MTEKPYQLRAPIDAALWAELVAAARRDERSATSAVRRALRLYIAEINRETP